jgi:hypothetical protein
MTFGYQAWDEVVRANRQQVIHAVHLNPMAAVVNDDYIAGRDARYELRNRCFSLVMSQVCKW